MEQKRTYYEILGLNRAAPPEEIKAARAKMLRIHHPDRHPDASGREKDKYNRLTAEINEAYEVLSNEASRSAYDRELDEAVSVAEAASAAYSQTRSQSASSGPSYSYQGFGDGAREGAPYHEYAKYGEFNESEVQKLYAASKKYVSDNRPPAQYRLKKFLRVGLGVTPRIADDLATQFLDWMCQENILYKKTGGNTRYHFVQSDEDDIDDNEHEEAPATSPQTTRRGPKRGSVNRWAVLWLVIGGWWGWHHFISSLANQAPEGSTVSSVPRDQTIESGTAPRLTSAGIPNAQASSAMQGAATVPTSAGGEDATSAPLVDSVRAGPVGASTTTASSAYAPILPGNTSVASPPVTWHVMQETPPIYPIAALRSGESGTTVVEVKVDAAGNIISARVHTSSGYRDLDNSAVRAVRTFKFASSGGEVADQGGTVLVPIDFRQQ